MQLVSIIPLLGLLAAVAWGLSDILAAKSAKSVGPILSTVFVNCISAVIFGAIYFVVWRSAAQVSLAGVLYAVVSGIVLSCGGAAFFVGLEAGPVSIVSPIGSTYPLAATGLALAVFHAQLTVVQILGICMVVLGVLAASGLLRLRRADRKLGRGPFLALVAAVTWGLGYTLLAQAMKNMDWPTVSIIAFTAAAVAMLVLFRWIKGEERLSVATVTAGLKSKFMAGATLTQLVGVIAIDIRYLEIND